MKRLSRIFLGGLLLWCWTSAAHAVLTIEITKGVDSALPIAVVPFGWQGAGAPAEDVAQVIAADLQRSGRFAPVPEKDLLSRPVDASQVNFRDWRLLNVENLVIGKVTATGAGYNIQFQLFDVFRGVSLTGYSMRTGPTGLRWAAHQIADIIYETLTGQPGAFATRIAYITAIGARNGERTYSLLIADSDGMNEQAVVSSKQPLMSPAWSPDGKRLAYVSFENRRAGIYIQDVTTGAFEKVSSSPGINGAPNWSPDGNRLAVVLSKGGNPDIYVLDLRSKRLQQLTDNLAIDTEPAWSPDGDTIIFTSDRGGTPQLYRMAAGGGRAERLTFEGNYNARASFSGSGKRVALVHGGGRGFQIAVLDLKTKTLQVISDGSLDESPSFAPNGSMVIYASEANNRGVLKAVAVDGGVTQRLSVAVGDAREPAWSPFLP